jgi:hypothetical protein
MLCPMGSKEDRHNSSVDNGIEWNSSGVWADPCSYSLHQKGWGPPRKSSCHSMLTGCISVHFYPWNDMRLLSAAVPMVHALPLGGAAMFSSSTLGYGTLDCQGSLWPNLRRSARSPCQRLPSKDGQLSRLASDLCLEYTENIHAMSGILV